MSIVYSPSDNGKRCSWERVFKQSDKKKFSADKEETSWLFSNVAQQLNLILLEKKNS